MVLMMVRTFSPAVIYGRLKGRLKHMAVFLLVTLAACYILSSKRTHSSWPAWGSVYEEEACCELAIISSCLPLLKLEFVECFRLRHMPVKS